VRRLDLGAALRAAAASWDSNWYQIIVSTGYAHSSPVVPKAGFYPGYPLLVSAVYRPLRALGGLLVPGYSAPPPVTPAGPFGQDVLLDAALLIVANLSLVVALVALWRLYEPELGAPVAVLGCGLLLTAPNAFFLSAGFSESSFIAATALTFLFAQRGRWLAAGAAGAAACLVRLPGVWLLLPLAVLWLRSPRPRPLWPAAAAAAGVLVGAAAFPAYCLAFFGDPLLYVHLQAGPVWMHRPSSPLTSYSLLLRRAYHGLLGVLNLRVVPGWPRTYVLDGVALVWGTACAALGWLRLPPAHALWTALMVGFPLLTGGTQFSINRYLLAAWPAFFFSAWVLRRVPLLAAAVMAVDLAAMFVLVQDHVRGFVG